jgi:tRNA threonylcarbamoyladenosine biosynthesis protein TsaE
VDKNINITLNQISQKAKDVAKQLKGGEILALVGPLGSGKTTFTKALGKALKVKNVITSPTFTLMQVYNAKLPDKQPVYLYHLDLYRTKSYNEIKALGITDVWGKKDTITIIEWADKIRRHWPKKTRVIKFVGE